jgi:hypothetical protein
MDMDTDTGTDMDKDMDMNMCMEVKLGHEYGIVMNTGYCHEHWALS